MSFTNSLGPNNQINSFWQREGLIDKIQTFGINLTIEVWFKELNWVSSSQNWEDNTFFPFFFLFLFFFGIKREGGTILVGKLFGTSSPSFHLNDGPINQIHGKSHYSCERKKYSIIVLLNCWIITGFGSNARRCWWYYWFRIKVNS